MASHFNGVDPGRDDADSQASLQSNQIPDHHVGSKGKTQKKFSDFPATAIILLCLCYSGIRKQCNKLIMSVLCPHMKLD